MRQIKQDCVRPERDTTPINVEAALAAKAPEAVFVVEEAAPPAPVVEQTPAPIEEALTDEQSPALAEAPEAPVEEVLAVEEPPEQVAATPSKLVFNNQMTKKELIAIALAAGWEVPAEMTRASILAALTKMNNE